MSAIDCAHVACSCTVDEPGEFCARACRDHAGEGPSEAGPCGCGHSECTSATPPEEGAELEEEPDPRPETDPRGSQAGGGASRSPERGEL